MVVITACIRALVADIELHNVIDLDDDTLVELLTTLIHVVAFLNKTTDCLTDHFMAILA